MNADARTADENARPPADPLLLALADYVTSADSATEVTHETAMWAILDAMGCGLLAWEQEGCRRVVKAVTEGLGPAPYGVPVPGSSLRLDPVNAAFVLGVTNRWLDFNDTWLAREWGHPSDSLAAILVCAGYREHLQGAPSGTPATMGDVASAMVRCYEIQGLLAMETSLNRLGLDHVLYVELASAAVGTWLLGGSRDQIVAVMSQVLVDGAPLRLYRHAPNTGDRKSWAAGSAASRAVRLALLTLAGVDGYPGVMSTPTWGFDEATLRGSSLSLPQAPASYVMDNILFKVSSPAEFHAQTALEAANALHPEVVGRIAEITAVSIETQESALRIISKQGPLHNAADRDHCLQYVVAIGLLQGGLGAEDYSDDAAADPRIDRLREAMTVTENPQYTRDYLDPAKRSIANSVQVRFADGSQTEVVAVEYPMGHRRRRIEAWPLLREKLETNARSRLPSSRVKTLMDLTDDPAQFLATPVSGFLDLLALDR